MIVTPDLHEPCFGVFYGPNKTSLLSQRWYAPTAFYGLKSIVALFEIVGSTDSYTLIWAAMLADPLGGPEYGSTTA